MDPSKSGTIILLKYLIYNTPSQRAATVVNLTEIILLLSRRQSSRRSYCINNKKKRKPITKKATDFPALCQLALRYITIVLFIVIQR